MKNESEFKGKNGFVMLAIWLVLAVLCSDVSAQPIVNAGTLHN
ncbi:MAG: hypothetical protein WC865_14600 [Bacteroidales bacterium]